MQNGRIRPPRRATSSYRSGSVMRLLSIYMRGSAPAVRCIYARVSSPSRAGEPPWPYGGEEVREGVRVRALTPCHAPPTLRRCRLSVEEHSQPDVPTGTRVRASSQATMMSSQANLDKMQLRLTYRTLSHTGLHQRRHGRLPM